MYAILQSDWFVLLWFWVCWLDVLNHWLVVMFWAWAFIDFCATFFPAEVLYAADMWRRYFVLPTTASSGRRCNDTPHSYKKWLTLCTVTLWFQPWPAAHFFVHILHASQASWTLVKIQILLLGFSTKYYPRTVLTSCAKGVWSVQR